MNSQAGGAAALASELTASDDTLALTLQTLDARLTQFAADGAGAQATIVKLDAALASLSQSPLAGQAGDLGALGLPVLGAWKAITAVVSKVMTETTGTSFESWVGVLAAGRAQFDDYIAKLRAVAVRGADLESDLAALDQARLATVGWRLAMKPVSEFARALDSMVAEITRRATPSADAPAPTTGQAGWLGQVQRVQHRLGEAVDVAADKLHLSRADVVRMVLSPLQDAKDRAANLPRELASLHAEVTLLDDLLRLLEAQLRTTRSELSADEASVAELTFAALVRVPGLEADLAATRAELVTVDGYLDGLARMRQDGVISDSAAGRLETEYRARGDAAHATLAHLEQRAARWREAGPELLRGGLAWADSEGELAYVRRAIGHWSAAEADQRQEYLQRSGSAMARAIGVIERLPVPGQPSAQ